MKKRYCIFKKETKNDIGQKSFVERFLSSVRSKMYRKNTLMSYHANNNNATILVILS